MLVTLCGVLLGNIVGYIFITLTVLIKDPSQISLSNLDGINIIVNNYLNAGTPFSLFLLISVFAFSLLFSVILVKALHKRSFSEVINGTKRIRWSRCFFGAMLWFAFSLLYLLIDFFLNPSNFEIEFNLSTFIPLVLVAIVFLPFQTTYEEYIFRGYLAQGIGALTRNRWLAIIIPGILFGLMHAANPEVEEHGFWLMMPHYIGFGLVFGLISVLDDGIELAMGVHAANNIFSAIFVTMDESALQTDALLKQLSINPTKDLIVFLVLSILAIFIFSKKYKWNFRILNKRIAPKEQL